MENKSYFIDKLLKKDPKANKKIIFTLLIIFFIMVISYTIYYKYTMNKYGHEIYSYSITTYQYLEEIADTVIEENFGFDLTAMPEDDISTYRVTYEEDKIELIYYLNTNEDLRYAPLPFMKITLSEDFEILEKSSNYSSEEEYAREIKLIMTTESILFTMLILLVLTSLTVCIIYLGLIVSWIHKKIDSKK